MLTNDHWVITDAMQLKAWFSISQELSKDGYTPDEFDTKINESLALAKGYKVKVPTCMSGKISRVRIAKGLAVRADE